MSDSGYAFISAYLKGEEARMITSGHIDSMARAARVPDVMGIIADTDIGAYLEGVAANDFDELDRQLWLYLSGCFQRLEWFTVVPDEIIRVMRAYITRYDVINIKAALQTIATEKTARLVPAGVISNNGRLDELAEATDIPGIVRLLHECRLQAYADMLREYTVEDLAKSRLRIEAWLDDEYYRELLEVTAGVADGQVLARAIGIIIDMTNLQIVLRAVIGGQATEAADYTIAGGYRISAAAIAEMLTLKLNEVPSRLDYALYREAADEIVSGYEKDRNISVVDEIINRYKLRLSREALSPRVLSPLVVAWYLIIKEIEVRNLRLVLKTMFDNIPLEEIKDYLVPVS